MKHLIHGGNNEAWLGVEPSTLQLWTWNGMAIYTEQACLLSAGSIFCFAEYFLLQEST